MRHLDSEPAGASKIAVSSSPRWRHQNRSPAAAADVPRRERLRKLEELYLANADGAYRLAYVLTGNRDAANDLVQEAFVRVAARFGHLRRSESLYPYLRRAIINLAKSEFRRRSVERRFLARFRFEPAAIASPDVETRHDLWKLLLQLPARQRIALVLRYYEDMTEQQAAEILGISARAVNALVARGLSQLRRDGGVEKWND